MSCENNCRQPAKRLMTIRNRAEWICTAHWFIYRALGWEEIEVTP